MIGQTEITTLFYRFLCLDYICHDSWETGLNEKMVILSQSALRYIDTDSIQGVLFIQQIFKWLIFVIFEDFVILFDDLTSKIWSFYNVLRKSAKPNVKNALWTFYH